MAGRSRSPRNTYSTPTRSQSRGRSRARSDPPQRSRSVPPTISQAVATQSSQPVTSIVDKQTPNSILKVVKFKRKLTKRAKKRLGKKKAFNKKVKKVMIKLGPANHYKESCNGSFTISNNMGAAVWNNTGTQTYQFSREGSSSDGFGYGGLFAGGTQRLQDCYKLLDYQNNELFLYTAAGGTSGQVESIATLTTANAIVARTTSETGKVWIKSITYTMSIRNPNTSSITLDIYQLVANQNYGPASSYRTAERAYDQCVSLENFTYDTPGAGDRVRLNQPQVSPMDIPNYGKYWKTKSGTRLILDPGECKQLTFTGSKGWYDGRKMQSLVACKGMTNEFLFIIGGGPCPGLTSATPLPIITWTKEIKWRQELGFGKPQNMPLSASVTY